MRPYFACALYACLMAWPVAAQTPPALAAPPTWAFNDLACAPSLLLADAALAAPLPPHRVIGSQDTIVRLLLGPGDTLVISGGSTAGLQAGQRYFVRRRVTTRGGLKTLPLTVHTAGWVQILGVDTTLATAAVLHACDGILIDDYLEPFVAPTIAESPIPGTTPHYENMGHIMTGFEGMHTAGEGQLLTIDRGTNAGVVVGQRFLVFRDKRDQRLDTTTLSKVLQDVNGQVPLVEIGEVLVVAVRTADATVQVVASKDAVVTGDLIAPIK